MTSFKNGTSCSFQFESVTCQATESVSSSVTEISYNVSPIILAQVSPRKLFANVSSGMEFQ